MSIVFPLDANVRFTNARLSVLTPRDRQALAGRVGVIQTDSAFVRKPTVYFPEDGARLVLRLFHVDPSHIELVEDSPVSCAAPGLNDDELDYAPISSAAGAKAPTPDDGCANLSQAEMDNLFD